MSQTGSVDNFADDEGSTTSYTSEESQDTSYSEMADALHGIVGLLNVLHDQLDELHTNCKTMEQPVLHLMVDQFADTESLKSSTFRTAAFRLAKAFPGSFGSPNARYPYKDIVAVLRNYVFNEKLVNDDGTIRTNMPLRTLFEIQEDITTFPTLLRHLRNVLV